GIPLSGIPLSGISINGAPLSGIPLSGIEIGTTPLSGIPLSGIGTTLRNTLIDCTAFDCDAPGATLGTAAAAGAIKAGAKIGDLSADLLKLMRLSDLIGATTAATDDHLRSALGSRTMADLTSWGNLTLGELPQLWPYLKLSDLSGHLDGVRLSDLANHLREFSPQQVRDALDAAHMTLASITGWDNVTLGQTGVLLQYLHLGDLSNALKGLRLGDLADAIQKPGGGTYSADDLRTALSQAMPNKSFSDLTDLGDLTLGELGKYGNTTLGQLLTAMAGSSELDQITFGDLLLTLMNPKQYPWESLDFGSVSAQALDDDPIGSPLTLAYRADAPDGLPRTVRVTVQLPHGAKIDTGSINGTSYGDASELKPDIDGDVATWTFTNVPANAPQSLTFDMQAPLNIGPAQVKATAFLPADDETSSDTASTVVKEAIEPNDTIANATTLPDDTIELSHISSADDVDVYKFSVTQPGTRVSISLSNLDADLDMVLYSPSVGSVQPTAGKKLDPVDDGSGSGLPGKDQAGTYTPQPSVGNEVKRPSDLGNLAVVQGSFNRGRTNEQIDTRVLTRTGTYYLAVTGYNAAVDSQPYALRLKRFVNTEQPACPVRTVTAGTQGTLLPQTLPTGTDTVFVVNRSRMAGLYGDDAANTLMDQLTGFTSWLNDSGLQKASVLTVDADPGVRAAYAAWDASPCVPSGANGVVSEIARVLNGYRSAGADLKNVVLVGGDDAVPFARVPDRTEVANESGYASTFSDSGNALYATFATSNVQTDNAYVDRSPYAFGDRTLYVPDTTIGRLVESPGEIGDQLTDFETANGKLAVGTGLVTGYDFLSDGAQGIDASVKKTYGSVSEKISDTWTRQDLEDAIHAIKPDLLSINAHFDHYRALPAAGNATHDESDLFQAAAVRGALNGDLAGSVVFSMGCHSGLSASDKLLSGDRALDFAQAVSSQGGVFVGNTGFGYGDTDTVALSEQLMGDFAQRLNGSMSVGEALLYAKNAYFSGLAEYTPYDEKVLQETTFYGLPFYRLDVANPPANPAPVSATITPDATTGLSVATTHLAPTYANRTADNGTTYTAAVDPTTGEDSLTTVQNRPVEPKVDTEYALPAGLAAHDALVLGLTSVDTPNTDPYVFQPTVDSSGERVDIGVDTAFPTRAVRVNSGLSPAGETFHVAATTGYFRTTAADGKGLQRTYRSMDVQTYLPSAGNDDWIAPTFSQVTGQVHDGVVSISAHVLDDRGDASRVKRVRLLLLEDPRSGVSTVWRGLDLVRTAGSDEWTGSLTTTGRNLEFVLQAVDAAGNVGVTNDKAQNFNDDGVVIGGTGDGDPTPVGDLQVTLSGTQGGENWYTGPVTVTATGGTKLVYEVVGESDPTGYQEPFKLTDTGLHTVRVTSGDGQTQTVTVPIDRVGPVAQIASPAPGQNLPVVPGALISYSCPDAGSGGTTCTATVDSSPIPVASGTTMLLAPGTHSVTVYAGPDRAGNPASVPTATRTFTVLGAPATVGTIGVSKAQDGAVTTLTVPFTGYSVLDYSGTVAWGDGGSTNCAMAGSGCTITRNGSGGGVLTVTHTYNTAWVDTTATVTVVDNLGQTASATVKVNKKTVLTATAALLQLKISTNVVELKSGAISATLKDASGNPLAGQTIKFTLPSGTSICTATTNSSGVAACPTNLLYTLAMVLAGKYYATFPGKDAWHGSSASASLIG
ncbi:Ig-like domain-containing protein, partial [Nocardioides marmorisolisilvae]